MFSFGEAAFRSSLDAGEDGGAVVRVLKQGADQVLDLEKKWRFRWFNPSAVHSRPSKSFGKTVKKKLSSWWKRLGPTFLGFDVGK